MKKLLIIFTGGTISAERRENIITRGQRTSGLLTLLPADTYDLIEPLDLLSENITPEILFRLFRTITDTLCGRDYRGILITHGTDTLAYTAQLAALLLGALPLPTILLGSKTPANHPHYDGKSNFESALRFLPYAPPGVYVASRHADGTDYIYPADSIMQPDYITDDFAPYRGNYYAKWSKSTLPERNAPSALLSNPLFRKQPIYPVLLSLFRQTQEPTFPHVWLLPAYVGQDYSMLDPRQYDGRYILHLLYHSGTACTAKDNRYSLPAFVIRCERAGKRLFLAPAEEITAVYESVLHLHIATILRNMPPERAWAMLLLASWLGKDPDELYGEF